MNSKNNTAVMKTNSGMGFAMASMICAILSLVGVATLLIIPNILIAIVPLVTGAVALKLSGMARTRKYDGIMTSVGKTFGIIALAALVYTVVFSTLQQYIR